MINDKNDFYENYIGIFLEILNFDNSSGYLEIIENLRNSTIEEMTILYNDEEEKQQDRIDFYNKLYDEDLFNYIKKQVANDNPTFFNGKINELNELLNNNKIFAGQSGMKINSDSYKMTFVDYYNNYLIALTELIGSENIETENAKPEPL